MKSHRNAMSERRIEELLAGNDRLFTLDPEQRNRIRRDMHAGAAHGTAPTLIERHPAEGAGDDGRVDDGRWVGRPIRRSRLAFAGVAAAVLLVLVVHWSVISPRNDTEVAAVGQPVGPGFEASDERLFCTEDLPRFTRAIEDWAGIENWSYVTDNRRPAPDLVERALDVLAALKVVRPAVEIAPTRAELLLLRPERAELNPQAGLATGDPLTGLDRERHEAAVTDVARLLATTIDDDPELVRVGCRFPALS